MALDWGDSRADNHVVVLLAVDGVIPHISKVVMGRHFKQDFVFVWLEDAFEEFCVELVTKVYLHLLKIFSTWVDMVGDDEFATRLLRKLLLNPS